MDEDDTDSVDHYISILNAIGLPDELLNMEVDEPLPEAGAEPCLPPPLLEYANNFVVEPLSDDLQIDEPINLVRAQIRLRSRSPSPVCFCEQLGRAKKPRLEPDDDPFTGSSPTSLNPSFTASQFSDRLFSPTTTNIPPDTSTHASGTLSSSLNPSFTASQFSDRLFSPTTSNVPLTTSNHTSGTSPSRVQPVQHSQYTAWSPIPAPINEDDNSLDCKQSLSLCIPLTKMRELEALADRKCTQVGRGRETSPQTDAHQPSSPRPSTSRQPDNFRGPSSPVVPSSRRRRQPVPLPSPSPPPSPNHSNYSDDDYPDDDDLVCPTFGNITKGRHFELELLAVDHCDKFTFTIDDYELRTRNLGEVCEGSKLPPMLRDVFITVLRLIQPIDLDPVRSSLRIVIETEALENPVSLAFMHHAALTADVILAFIEDQMSSNDKFDVTEPMKLSLQHTKKRVQGSGRSLKGPSRRDILDLMDWCKCKQSVVRITNDDDICLARALVVGMALADKKSDPSDKVTSNRYDNVRTSSRPAQRWAAEDLHVAAGVPQLPCGLEEVRRFQDHVGTKYRIVVYSAEAQFTVVFDDKTTGLLVPLLYHSNHFDTITTIKGFFANSYYCQKCLKTFDHSSGHICSGQCSACRSYECSQRRTTTLKCTDCNRYFYGPNCFALHRTTGVCQTVRRCVDCGFPEHADDVPCGSVKCKNCGQWVAQDHQCYISQIDPDDSPDPIYFYFDVESMVDGIGKHVPNLVVLQDTAGKTYTFKNSETFCRFVLDDDCGIPKPPPEVRKKLEKQKKKEPNPTRILVSHYGRGYDHFVVLEFLLKHFIQPKVIFQGAKLLTMEVSMKGHLYKFIDSHSFMPAKLAALPKMFGFQHIVNKGTFPHLFNVAAHQNYDGPFPGLEWFKPETLKESSKKELEDWHTQESRRYLDDPLLSYNLQAELSKYCTDDVNVLRLACQEFRQLFKQVTSVDPFKSCVTLPGACHRAYRTKWMPADTIGVLSESIGARKDSKAAQEWIRWESHSRNLEFFHSRNKGEFKIGKYFVDGYNPETNTVLEFHGDFFHGNPSRYSAITYNPLLKAYMGELYERTLDREEEIRKLGYNLIVMWESDFEDAKRKHPAIRAFVTSLNIKPPLQPRHAFYGGRTNAMCLYMKTPDGYETKYKDVTSMYAYINKTGKMPTGHPRILLNEPFDAAKHFGLFYGVVLPPDDLLYPVLPLKSNGKLLFALCAACAETREQKPCYHSPASRALEGTWCTPELVFALERGYKVLETFEIWVFDNFAEETATSTGLFTEYVNTFLRLKTEASGYPAWTNGDPTLETEFVQSFANVENIQLNRTAITSNPGLRSLAKLCLNSFWGRYGMRTNLSKTDYVTSVNEWQRLLNSSEFLISQVKIVNRETLLVSYAKVDDFVTPAVNTNVVIAAFTTTLARLHLYNFLEKVGEGALYCDTDSIIYTHPTGQDPLAEDLADYLGMLTNELAAHGPDISIAEFVSAGPKNYGYKLTNGHSDWKVRGITQSYRTSQVLNYEVMTDFIINSRLDDTVVVPAETIKRCKVTGAMFNRSTMKTYRFGYDKNVLLPDFATKPYGYKWAVLDVDELLRIL